jgi:hypothetical protein
MRVTFETEASKDDLQAHFAVRRETHAETENEGERNVTIVKSNLRPLVASLKLVPIDLCTTHSSNASSLFIITLIT